MKTNPELDAFVSEIISEFDLTQEQGKVFSDKLYSFQKGFLAPIFDRIKTMTASMKSSLDRRQSLSQQAMQESPIFKG